MKRIDESWLDFFKRKKAESPFTKTKLSAVRHARKQESLSASGIQGPERESIYDYSADSSSINNRMRNPSEWDDPSVDSDVHRIKQAMKTHPTLTDRKVFRGIASGNPDKYTGKKVQDRGFISTSKSYNAAFRFAYVGGGYDKQTGEKHIHIQKIRVKHGTPHIDAENFHPAFAHEKEKILPPGNLKKTKHTVHQINMYGKNVTIHMHHYDYEPHPISESARAAMRIAGRTANHAFKAYMAANPGDSTTKAVIKGTALTAALASIAKVTHPAVAAGIIAATNAAYAARAGKSVYNDVSKAVRLKKAISKQRQLPLTEKWNQYEYGEEIWDSVRKWVSKNAVETKKAIESNTAFSRSKVKHLVIWNIDGTYSVDAHTVLRETGKEHLIDDNLFPNFHITISQYPWETSEYHTYTDDNTLDHLHEVQIGIENSSDRAKDRYNYLKGKYKTELSKIALANSLGISYNPNFDPGDFVFSKLDLENLSNDNLNTIFVHEFTHFMDKAKMFKNMSPLKALNREKKQEAIDAKKVTGRQHSKRYFNLPTEVNAHSNELVRSLDRTGMMKHIKSPADIRKLAIHMLHNSSDSKKSRWLQINHFVKHAHKKNIRKLMRRIRQYQNGLPSTIPVTKPIKVKAYDRNGIHVATHSRNKPKTLNELKIVRRYHVGPANLKPGEDLESMTTQYGGDHREAKKAFQDRWKENFKTRHDPETGEKTMTRNHARNLVKISQKHPDYVHLFLFRPHQEITKRPPKWNKARKMTAYEIWPGKNMNPVEFDDTEEAVPHDVVKDKIPSRYIRKRMNPDTGVWERWPPKNKGKKK